MPDNRRSRRKWMVALAPAMATAAVLTVGAGPAHAASVEKEARFTFTTSAGERVTCTIVSAQHFPYDEDDDLAGASTSANGGPACENSRVAVEVTYRLPDGRPAEGRVSGRGHTFGTWEPVADEFRSEHQVAFIDCDFRASDCNYDTTLVQPK